MGGQQITDLDRRGRKPKEESRAEELHEKLAAWRQIPESSRPSLCKLADQLGTSEQLLSHYLKTQDEWEARRQAARCQELGDDRGLVYWLLRAELCDSIRKIEREINAKPPDDEPDILRRLNEKSRKADIRWLQQLASQGHPVAREVLAKLNKKK